MKIVRQESRVLAVSEVSTTPFKYNDKLLEYVGRLCYKSEDKITEKSHIKFLDMLRNKKHFGIFEHSWDARAYTYYEFLGMKSVLDLLYEGKYLNIATITIKRDDETPIIISGNLRAFEEFWDDNIEGINYQQAKDVTKLAKERNRYDLLSMTVHFITNRAIANELVRHRMASFAQESTRYCNYSNNRFGSQCTFILPCQYDNNGNVNIDDFISIYNCGTPGIDIWLSSMKQSEQAYFALIKDGQSAEEARGVLPLDTKTELIVTANLMTWKHIFNQRYRNLTGKSHIQMIELMIKLLLDLQSNADTLWIYHYLTNDFVAGVENVKKQ